MPAWGSEPQPTAQLHRHQTGEFRKLRSVQGAGDPKLVPFGQEDGGTASPIDPAELQKYDHFLSGPGGKCD